MLTVEDIARTCHEANRVLCQYFADDSQVSWSEAPEWQKKSAIAGVQFRIDNPDSTAEQIHDQWCQDKRADGWVL